MDPNSLITSISGAGAAGSPQAPPLTSDINAMILSMMPTLQNDPQALALLAQNGLLPLQAQQLVSITPSVVPVPQVAPQVDEKPNKYVLAFRERMSGEAAPETNSEKEKEIAREKDKERITKDFLGDASTSQPQEKPEDDAKEDGENYITLNYHFKTIGMSSEEVVRALQESRVTVDGEVVSDGTTMVSSSTSNIEIVNSNRNEKRPRSESRSRSASPERKRQKIDVADNSALSLVVDNNGQAESLQASSKPAPELNLNSETPVKVFSKFLYVGNLAPDVSHKNLEDLFKTAGDLVSIKILSGPGFSRYAFIQYKKREDAEKARQTLNGKELKNRSVRIGWKHPLSNDRSTPFNADEGFISITPKYAATKRLNIVKMERSDPSAPEAYTHADVILGASNLGRDDPVPQAPQLMHMAPMIPGIPQIPIIPGIAPISGFAPQPLGVNPLDPMLLAQLGAPGADLATQLVSLGISPQIMAQFGIAPPPSAPTVPQPVAAPTPAVNPLAGLDPNLLALVSSNPALLNNPAVIAALNAPPATPQAPTPIPATTPESAAPAPATATAPAQPQGPTPEQLQLQKLQEQIQQLQAQLRKQSQEKPVVAETPDPTTALLNALIAGEPKQEKPANPKEALKQALLSALLGKKDDKKKPPNSAAEALKGVLLSKLADLGAQASQDPVPIPNPGPMPIPGYPPQFGGHPGGLSFHMRQDNHFTPPQSLRGMEASVGRGSGGNFDGRGRGGDLDGGGFGGGSGRGGRESNVLQGEEPGDWLCNVCSVSNFRKRTECFKCHAPKGAPAQDGGNKPGSAGRGGGLIISEHYKKAEPTPPPSVSPAAPKNPYLVPGARTTPPTAPGSFSFSLPAKEASKPNPFAAQAPKPNPFANQIQQPPKTSPKATQSPRLPHTRPLQAPSPAVDPYAAYRAAALPPSSPYTQVAPLPYAAYGHPAGGYGYPASVPPQAPQMSPQAGGQPDYSAQWVQYYVSMGLDAYGRPKPPGQ